VSDIDTAVVDGLKVLDPNGRLEKLPRRLIAVEAEIDRVTRVPPRVMAVRNCTRDEGGPFGFGNQVLISSHRKLLRLNAVVVSVAETPGR